MADYNYKLSIIVPVYNVEQYIVDCLDSILNSDLPKDEYEVVMINDGSTDGSGKIAQQYVDNNVNFKYIEQENQGLSVARNTGIKACSGEYIWFVDSDDLIYKHIVPAYEIIKMNPKIDVLECRLKVFHDRRDFVFNQLDGDTTYVSGIDYILNGEWPGSVCKKIIKKEFMIHNNLFFVPGLIHQDTELSYRLYAHAKSVCRFNFYIYHYRWSEDSLTRTNNPQKIFNDKKSNIYIYKSFEKLADSFDGKNDLVATRIKNTARRIILATVYNIYSHKKEYKQMGIYDKLVAELRKQDAYPLKGNFYSLKRNILAKYLNLGFLLK